MAIQTTELIALDTSGVAAELVFGSIDGIFSVLGIIAAGGSASLTSLQIFATGLGGAAAGALSVFAATYLSQTTEKKTRLLNAWESSKNALRKTRDSNGQRREPTKKDHAKFHEMLSKVHRRALLSGFVTSFTSSMASLALLLPLVFLTASYSVSVSILAGIGLLSLLGAFRGVTLKQSAAKSAIKMVILGVIIIIAARILGTWVQTLFLPTA
ncbi:MAG TPA: VIT1/CCC1 transporter family protein [Candidatus Bathyarchaeia archaeon]|nr:VIT1/CCC1 transporter family protein [Candidatus Bathyarchaeia archaeon]